MIFALAVTVVVQTIIMFVTWYDDFSMWWPGEDKPWHNTVLALFVAATPIFIGTTVYVFQLFFGWV